MSTLPQTANANLTAPNSGDSLVIGAPSTPGLARSQTANTALNFTNNDLAHVCDITGDLKYSIALVSFKVGEAIETIRTELKAIWEANSSSPFGNQISGAIKYIKAQLNNIKKFITKVNEARAAAQKFIEEMEKLIAYIASLPMAIAKQLTACVAGAIASVKDAVKNSAEIVKSQESGTANTASSQQTTTEEDLKTEEDKPIPPTNITPEFIIP